MRSRAALLLTGLVLSVFGCLDTRGRERTGYSQHVLPSDAEIRSIEDDEVLSKRIGNNDFVDGMVALRSGYAGGSEIRYWDFGTASASAEPMWSFRKRGDDGMPDEIGHPDLIDSAPGDMNYSPFRAQYIVFVTDAYDGERITTLQALEDAIELGLLEEPEPIGTAVNRPVVREDTRVDQGDGREPLEPVQVYYRGRIATHLQLGGMQEGVGQFPLERGSVATANAYLLRRQNEADALEETLWLADLNADGDMEDSNVVFGKNVGEEGYTSLWTQVDVIVSPDYAWGDSQDEADLFAREEWGLVAVDGAFVSFTASDTLLNRPILQAP